MSGKSDSAFMPLSRLIIGYGLNSNRLAAIIDLSQPTCQKKLKNPDLFTLGDLQNISNIGKVPFAEILETLRDK